MNIVKDGKTAQRKQSYFCKDCRRQFIRDCTNLRCVGGIHALIVPLTMNGSVIPDISRVLLLSLNTVLKTLRQAASEVGEPSVPPRIPDLELDEFWSPPGSKKRQRWTWYGFDRQRHQLAASVNDRRTDAAGERLRKKLDNCQISRYHTDDWQSYKKFLAKKKHQIGKRCIKRHNLNFRIHIKWLHRRTTYDSKSAEMYDAVLKLYINHSNTGHHHLRYTTVFFTELSIAFFESKLKRLIPHQKKLSAGSAQSKIILGKISRFLVRSPVCRFSR